MYTCRYRYMIHEYRKANMVMLLLSRTIASASPSMFFSAPSKALHEPGRVSLRMETKQYWNMEHLPPEFQSINLSNAAVSESATRIKRWLLLWSLQCDMFHACFHQSNLVTAVRSGMYISASGVGSHRQCDLSYQNPMSNAKNPQVQTQIAGSLVSFDLHQEVMKIYLCFSVHNYTFQLVREMTSLLTKHTAGVCSCSTARTDSK